MHYLYKDFCFGQPIARLMHLPDCLAHTAAYLDGCAFRGKWTLVSDNLG